MIVKSCFSVWGKMWSKVEKCDDGITWMHPDAMTADGRYCARKFYNFHFWRPLQAAATFWAPSRIRILFCRFSFNLISTFPFTSDPISLKRCNWPQFFVSRPITVGQNDHCAPVRLHFLHSIESDMDDDEGEVGGQIYLPLSPHTLSLSSPLSLSFRE